MSEIHRMALRIREGLSRNRHFEELSLPSARRARKLLRRLDGLERELASGARAQVEVREGGYLLTLEFPAVRARREAWVTAEERTLLPAGRLKALFDAAVAWGRAVDAGD